MTQTTTPKRIHPLIATAAVAVILVSLVGVAAITGLLPSSNSTPTAANALSASDMPNKDGDMQSDNSGQPARTDTDAPQHQASSNHKVASHTPAHSGSTANKQNDYDNNAAQTPAICESCGVVESVRAVEHHAAQGSGLGAAAGAILGGVLGHQVGGGNGKNLATVAGAVGGGFAGNEIEKRKNTSTSYEVRVRMENGNTRTFTPSAQPDWRAGDRVKVVDGNLTFR